MEEKQRKRLGVYNVERIPHMCKLPIKNCEVRKENIEGGVVRNGRACYILNRSDGQTQSQAAMKPWKIE